MLNLAIPIALATIAQMFVITVNELDLSIGTFVGFVGCVTATLAARSTPLCSARSIRSLIGVDRRVYAGLGALIYLRNLPSIVVTLGMSFVWQGLAILLLPQARRQGAGMAARVHELKPPFVPFPIVAAIVIAARRPCRPDAHLLWRDPARCRRQSGGDRPRRLVAAQDQGDRCSRSPASSASSPAWR